MARHVFFGLLASLGLLFGARDALAQRAPELTGADEVILKNGGMLRGTVVAIEPEKSVTIFVMLTGEQRNVPWSEVERVERGKNPPPSPEKAEPKAPEPDPSASPPPASEKDLELAYTRGEPGVVRLHVDSAEGGIQLFRVNTAPPVQYRQNPSTVAPFPTSDLICLAPCDKLLDGRLGQQYFFGGAAMPPSSTFQIYKRSGTVTAHVEPGSDAKYVTGIMMGTMGGLTAMIGSAVWVLGYVEGQQQRRNANGTPMVDGMGQPITEYAPILPGGEIAGPISFGIGVASLVVGIVVGTSGAIGYTLSPKSPGVSVGLSPTGLSLRF